MRILITGGTGSLGHALIPRLLADPAIERVMIYSRDEQKQHAMLGDFDDRRLVLYLGDVRDRDRLAMAMRGVDAVIHAASMKIIEACKWDPDECTKTINIGSMNVKNAALERGVKKMLFISTDKAVAAHVSYGKAKAAAESNWLDSNAYQSKGEALSVIRYGNVAASRGSVIPTWRRLVARRAPLPLTDPDMTRFWITLPEAADAVLETLRHMEGGEVFIPKMPAFRLVDLADAMAPPKYGYNCTITGIRADEKLHEDMITVHEARQVHEEKNVFVILPSDLKPGRPVPEGFQYASNLELVGSPYLTVDELRERLQHV
jgi:UDP-N-acetylglucosamine 4,6-dehydratase